MLPLIVLPYKGATQRSITNIPMPGVKSLQVQAYGLFSKYFTSIFKQRQKQKPMAFKAKLVISGKEVNIIAHNYELKQETDAAGRPAAVTRGGKINLTVESTGDTTFFEWMCNNFERKDGSVVYIKRDADATLKELKFTEAYMVAYRENFNSTDDNPVTESFTISAKSIEMGTGKLANLWP